jgi:hypothetical protein
MTIRMMDDPMATAIQSSLGTGAAGLGVSTSEEVAAADAVADITAYY